MPIDTIGQLNLQIAEQQARGIEGDIEGRRELARGIQGGVEAGMSGAQNALQFELDAAKKREADEFLKTGVNGVKQYATEMGLDPNIYVKMASNIKDPTKFADVYKTIKGAGEKKATENDVLEFAKQIEALGSIEDDATFEKSKNMLVPKAASGTKEAQDRKVQLLKELEQNRVARASAKKSSKAPSKSIVDLRKEFRTESKNIDEILRQTEVLRTAFNKGSFKGNKVGSDQALIMTFNKILDPTSVVRESEFARTGQSQGAIDAAAGWFKKLQEGGSGLTDDGRKAVFKMSELISQGAMIDRFRKIIEFERLSDIDEIPKEQMDLIVPGFSKHKEDYEEWKSDPEGYKDRIAEELNQLLKEAQSQEITNDVNSTIKSTKKVDASMSVQDMLSTLPSRED